MSAKTLSHLSLLPNYMLRRLYSTKKKNLIIDTHSSLRTIGINRYETRNSLNIETLEELAVALDEFESDDKAKVAILHGEGGTFCSGFDLNDVRDIGYDHLLVAAKRLLRQPLCVKPTVCAVDGFSVAEGFDLALACDLRIIEDTAVMGFLGRRFGCPQSLDGGVRLANLIGVSRSLDLTMTARLISGKVANDLGLAARCVATGSALGQAIHMSLTQTKIPFSALLHDKLTIVNSRLEPGSDDRVRNDKVLETLRPSIEEEMSNGVRKYHEGFGRHGKFFGLKTPAKSWEIEVENVNRPDVKDGLNLIWPSRVPDLFVFLEDIYTF